LLQCERDLLQRELDATKAREQETAEQETAERYERLQDRIPLGRVGKPAALSRGHRVSLASAASDYRTGHLLTVDGGWLAS